MSEYLGNLRYVSLLGTVDLDNKMYPLITIVVHFKPTSYKRSLYMNDLCATAQETVTNLQGFISLEEISLLSLLRDKILFWLEILVFLCQE